MIPEECQERLKRLNQVFLEENRNLNLSALRTQELSWTGNILDALSILSTPLLSPLSAQKKILDLGTGGGFPLLPLALCVPGCTFVGLDATAKKISAVERIAHAMELRNVTLITGRSEEVARDPAHRERYDLVLSRAVAPLHTLLELTAPFAKVGGHVVLWKSVRIEKELKDSLLARAELSCQLTNPYEYVLPDNRGKRQLLIFQKRFTTQEKYPRAVGIPKKKPLM